MRHGHRSLVRTDVKNMSGFLFWVLLPIHFLLNGVTIVYFLRFGLGNVILQTKLDALKGISKNVAETANNSKPRLNFYSRHLACDG